LFYLYLKTLFRICFNCFVGWAFRHCFPGPVFFYWDGWFAMAYLLTLAFTWVSYDVWNRGCQPIPALASPPFYHPLKRCEIVLEERYFLKVSCFIFILTIEVEIFAFGLLCSSVVFNEMKVLVSQGHPMTLVRNHLE
jgi:hypothetical protein